MSEDDDIVELQRLQRIWALLSGGGDVLDIDVSQQLRFRVCMDLDGKETID
jgi:hypothetical protein